MAKKDCLERGLKLASIATTEENEFLKTALSEFLIILTLLSVISSNLHDLCNLIELKK